MTTDQHSSYQDSLTELAWPATLVLSADDLFNVEFRKSGYMNKMWQNIQFKKPNLIQPRALWASDVKVGQIKTLSLCGRQIGTQNVCA